VTGPHDPEPWVDALAGSHDRLSDIVGGLGADGVRRPSYCGGWTIAQVLSHLGSGAEIFEAILDAVLAGEPAPGHDSFPAVWERWNAMTPDEQVEGFCAADGAFVEHLEHLGDRLDELEFVMFGSVRMDAAGFVGTRLSEHAVHTWDVAVALDPAATVDDEAVALLVDRLPQMAARIGHAGGAGSRHPLEVTIRTTDPFRRFTLRVDDAVTLMPAEESREPAGSTLTLPSEAFVRLVYGRLDPAHSPSLEPEELVDGLRVVFPGF
jgi:uncharacterized protein (TIGR03083 family)